MKLGVGMYVRTKVGKIAKIINKYDNSGSLHKENFVWVLDDCSVLALHSQKVIKASYNLIDLIEVGDYVNGFRVYEVKANCVMVGYECFATKFDDEQEFLYQTIFEDDIKSIVTKEQFESMSYKIENK